MVAFAAMRLVIVLFASGGIAVSARASDAQSIRVATPTEVVRETDPRRFSEPHLAVYPTDPNRFLAAAFSKPLHPYTAGLQASLPKLGVVQDRLRVIPGTVPNPARFPAGCRFHPRCPVMIDKCLDMPALDPYLPSHLSRCWRSAEIAAGKLDPIGPAVST